MRINSCEFTDFRGIVRTFSRIFCTFAAVFRLNLQLMIRVLADSGSTKTDWIIKNVLTGEQLRWQTRGINPSLMDDTQIIEILVSEVRTRVSKFIGLSQDVSTMKSFFLDESTSFSSISSEKPLVTKLSFYGSGCRPEQCVRMQHLLMTSVPAQNVYVASDLLGAARALCGSTEGIVCILGTGSASAHYDGESFVQSTPSLGFILGDEGSGTSLGKHLLSNVLKKQLPEYICSLFLREYSISISEVIQRVYREPNPNRFMSQFTHFLAKYISEPSIEAMIVDEFAQFFLRNIVGYQRPDLEVHFVGSVAAVFSQQLHLAANKFGLRIGQISKAPLDQEGVFETMFAY